MQVVGGEDGKAGVAHILLGVLLHLQSRGRGKWLVQYQCRDAVVQCQAGSSPQRVLSSSSQLSCSAGSQMAPSSSTAVLCQHRSAGCSSPGTPALQACTTDCSSSAATHLGQGAVVERDRVGDSACGPGRQLLKERSRLQPTGTGMCMQVA